MNPSYSSCIHRSEATKEANVVVGVLIGAVGLLFVVSLFEQTDLRA